MEELVIQDKAMDRMYPNSVNTIRMVTKNGVLIAAVLRIGRDDKGIDNLSAGGIAAVVDIDLGIVSSVGRTYLDETFVRHPSSGTIIPGFEIPKWEQCKQYVQNACKMCEGIPVIGWDIAITSNGPTIIEVNEGTEIEVLELPYGKGFRKIIQE